MAESNDQEKTEPATPKKRDDARKKGQVAKSKEVSSVLVLLSALTVFYFVGGWMFGQLMEITQTVLQKTAYWSPTIEDAHAMAWELFTKVIVILSPLIASVIIAAVAGNVLQTGFMIANEAMTPKLEKLNPLTGFKTLVSVSSLVELIKSIFKIIVIGGISYSVLNGVLDQIPGLVDLTPAMSLIFFGEVALKMGYYVCLLLIILTASDVFFQRWKFEKDMRMTKQEVKDENKQREGDPQVRGRIRATQREMAMRRMMEAVPDATVVITNPTHLAIAIKFERMMPAPTVVAKGAGNIAERIKQIATEHDIPVIEQKPLARTLFKTVEIGAYIPVDLYHAVAEILAYVYRLKGLVHS